MGEELYSYRLWELGHKVSVLAILRKIHVNLENKINANETVHTMSKVERK